MKHLRLISLLTIFMLLFAVPALVAADDDDADGDEVRLVLAGWSSSTEETNTLNALLEEFTATTGIEVEWQISTDHRTQLQTAFASGTYPNVFYIDSSYLLDWVDAGVVAIGEDVVEDQDGFYEALLDIFTVGGTLYCPPKDFSTMALQFNQDLFDAAGLDYPTADWTWDDVYAAAEALTDPDAGVIGLVTPPELPRWLPFLHQNGGIIFDEITGEYAMNDEAALEALAFYISFSTDGIGGAPSVVDAGWGGEAFGEGRAAMAMEGNWVINYLLEDYPELNWGVVELPVGPVERATMAFTVCYGVGADNDFLEESWELVNFLTGEEGQLATTEVSFGPMPTRPSAAEAYVEVWLPRSEGRGFDAGDVEAFIAGAEYSYPWQLPVGFGPFVDAFNAALQRAFAGEITAEDVIAEAEAAAMEIMGN
ncbi:MAG: ABC transporter substrate-binding protein [Anaerolineaceae bacterium]|nr:MAG: ABC transporter substrate-binding protein [Anaerolineaceae bacterium]